MIRPTLLPLIARVRELLAEDDGNCSFWSDSAIAEALASNSDTAYELLLHTGHDVGEGTLVTANYKGWEDGAKILNSSYQSITPLYADPVAGQWVVPLVETDPQKARSNHYYHYYVSGISCDVWGAAADLLMAKATVKSAKFDVSSGDSKLSRSQETAALMKMAKEYRAKARVRTIKAVRSDVP